MDLLQMRYVTAIAGLGSMTKAAETLHVSQSALSLSCKRLEEELGVKLFVRDGRYLKLTEAGSVFVEKAAAILDESDMLLDTMKRLRAYSRNAVCFGSEVIDFSNELIALYRQLDQSIDVVSDNTTVHGIVDKLCSHTYDFALTLNDLSSAVVESVQILDEPMLLLVGPTSAFSKKSEVYMRDLQGVSLVTTSEDFSIGILMRQFFSGSDTAYSRVQQVGDSDSIAVKVYNNFGISFVPECVVNLWLKTPEIRIRGVQWIPIEQGKCRRRIYLTCLRDERHTPACEAFLKYLSSYCMAVRKEHSYPTYNELLSYL